MTTDNPMLPSAKERVDRFYNWLDRAVIMSVPSKTRIAFLVSEIRAAEDAARERGYAQAVSHTQGPKLAREKRIATLEQKVAELQARITLAIEATECCTSCVRTWLSGELDEDQQKRVQIIIDAARGGEKDG